MQPDSETSQKDNAEDDGPPVAIVRKRGVFETREGPVLETDIVDDGESWCPPFPRRHENCLDIALTGRCVEYTIMSPTLAQDDFVSLFEDGAIQPNRDSPLDVPGMQRTARIPTFSKRGFFRCGSRRAGRAFTSARNVPLDGR